MWAALWWLVLLGRSTSWGRVYFPDAPHIVFKTISVILVGGLLLSLLSTALRKEIARRMRKDTFPLWLMAVTVVTFLAADTIEHHRLLAPLLVRDLHYFGADGRTLRNTVYGWAILRDVLFYESG
ncbi:Uncharacterised protein [Kluyvera cryocrescens]|uniref:Uncharacterized protein n=1 Tax=Kluyvera cryocrescens TaxID=580 RepID=A0A485A6T9_KLUCR|nr:Uncharacterised protein [Kluyvera cryocrescens]